MSTERDLIRDGTTIKEAVQFMEEKHLMNLPVEE